MSQEIGIRLTGSRPLPCTAAGAFLSPGTTTRPAVTSRLVDAAVVTAVAALGSATIAGGVALAQSQMSESRRVRHDRETREMKSLRDALDDALTSARQRYGATRDLRDRLVFGESANELLAETQPLIPTALANCESGLVEPIL